MVFKDVSVSWDGVEYTCPADKVFKLIRHMEKNDINIFDVIANGHVTAKADALSVCLEFMGVSPAPTPEQCYESMFLDGDSITHVMLALQMMIVPPNVVEQAAKMTEAEAEKAKKKPEDEQAR